MGRDPEPAKQVSRGAIAIHGLVVGDPRHGAEAACRCDPRLLRRQPQRAETDKKISPVHSLIDGGSCCQSIHASFTQARPASISANRSLEKGWSLDMHGPSHETSRSPVTARTPGSAPHGDATAIVERVGCLRSLTTYPHAVTTNKRILPAPRPTVNTPRASQPTRILLRGDYRREVRTNRHPTPVPDTKPPRPTRET